MPAEIPVPGPVGPVGPLGPPGPALAGGNRKYAKTVLAGSSGYSTPDDASLDLTDNFRYEALVLPDNIASGAQQVVLAKSNTVGNQRSCNLSFASDGSLIFQWNIAADGTATGTRTHTSTVPLPTVLRSDAPFWIRADYSGTTGPSGDAVVNFYYSIDNGLSWIQLGASAVRNSAHSAGPVFSGSANVTVGQAQSLGTTPYAGRVYEARIWDITTIGSPVLKAQLDVRGLANGSSTYTDPTGKVWTPMASTTLFSDEFSFLDLRGRSILSHNIVPGPDGYILKVQSGYAEWVAATGSSSGLTLNVVDYGGATGNGATDDTTAFALTIAAVAAAGGGIVYVPKPAVSYRITSAIDLNNVSNVTMRGDGKKLTIITWAGGYGTTTTNNAVLIRGTSSNIVVEHLSINGQKNLLPASTTTALVNLSTTPTDVPVTNAAGYAASGTVKLPDWTTAGAGNPSGTVVWKTVTYTGVDLTGGANKLLGCTLTTGTAQVPSGSTVQIGSGGLGMNIGGTGSDIKVRWVRIFNCASSAVFHANQTDIEFADCQIDTNGVCTNVESSPTSGGDGIHDNGGSLRSAVRNCWIFSNAGTGVGHANTAGAPQSCDVTGCMVYNNGFIGIAGGSNGIGMIVRGNRCMNNINNNIDMGGCNQFVVADNYSLGGRTGIDVDGGTGFTAVDGIITGNTVTGSLVRYGISAVRFKNVTITGNTVSNSFWDGINVGSAAGTCTSATITGNTVRNSGQDGSSTRNGIHISSVTDVTVSGNRCYDDQATKTQQYAVQSIGTSDYVVITGNSLRGNAVGATSLVGANNQVGVNT